MGSHGFHQVLWAQQAQPQPRHAAMKIDLGSQHCHAAVGAEQRAAPGKKHQHPQMSPGATWVGNAGGDLHLRAGPTSTASVSQIKCSDLVKFEYIPGTRDKSQPLSLPYLPNFKLLLQKAEFLNKIRTNALSPCTLALGNSLALWTRLSPPPKFNKKPQPTLKYYHPAWNGLAKLPAAEGSI